MFNSEKYIILETDASDFALRAILKQPDNEERYCLVFYYSRKFAPAELGYDIYNKKLLAIVNTLKTWKYYLERIKYPVKVKTDYKNLIYFMTTKELFRRQAR